MTAKTFRLQNAESEPALPLDPCSTDEFRFVMTPYRSLSDRAFAIFIVAILGVAFLTQLFFLAIGVWVAAAAALFNGMFLAAAFGACRSDRKRAETLAYTDGFLVVTRRRGNGEVISEAKLPAYGLALHRHVDPDHGCRRLLLSCQGRTVEIASELSPPERQSLGEALVDSLRRRGLPVILRETSGPAAHGTGA